MSGKRFALILAAVVIALAVVPYLLAFQTSNDSWQFGGFLINPADGYSYLAKMQQGARGEWRFTLPYTAEPGEGAYLFLFYISLGRLAKLLNIPLLTAFHSARVLSGIFLVWSLYRLTNHVFARQRDRNLALLVAAAGSGLGWLAVFFGYFTSDFWVAEAFPFLSFYTNPHFPLGLALMILAIFLPGQHTGLLNFLLAGLIGLIQPFGVVIVLLVKLAEMIYWVIHTRPGRGEFLAGQRVRSLVGFGLGGGPVLLYQFWMILNDPVLAAWHAQNRTPTPGLVDLLLSLSPCLLAAFFGVKRAWQSGPGKTLLFWGGISLALVLVPWSLQRRFLTGVFVPLACLSVWGIGWLADNLGPGRKFWTALLLVLTLPTNFVVIASGMQAAFSRDSQVYISKSIVTGLDWLSDNAAQGALVLAEKEVGLVIPAATGRRVIYGHPFETVTAEDQLDFLDKFFYSGRQPEYYLETLSVRNVDYVFISDQVDPGLIDWLDLNWPLVFEEGGQRIYQREDK